MTHVLVVRFKISGIKKAYTIDQLDEAIVDPFFFEGGVEINPMRFGNDKAAVRWFETNNIRYFE